MTVAEPPALQGIRTAPEGLPEYTLGWKILGWCSKWLRQPDGPDAGQPWVFTKEQVHFILWFYAVDRRGRFIYRYAMLRRSKGWGKDPIAAAICFVEFVGPCRFSHWEDGRPVGKEHNSSWVQVAAVSKEQTRNTMAILRPMISAEAIAEFDIEPAIEIWYANGHRCMLEAVTTSPRTREGNRPTFVLKNETHHWLPSNDGIEMSKVLARNVGKSRDGSARQLAISNAHAPGENSDAERDHDLYTLEKAGAIPPTGMLYDSVEAPDGIDVTDMQQLRHWIDFCKGDSYWVDTERIMQEFTVTEEAEGRRFYLNQLAAGASRYFNIATFRACLRPGYKVRRGRKIALGFDGSVNDDWTALIATELATGHQWPIGIWRPELTETGIHINEEAVDAAVIATFEDWDVVLLVGDPYYWREWLAKWAGLFNRPGMRRVIEFATTQLRNTAIMLLNYKNAMRSGEMTHNGEELFEAGIANAFKVEQGFVDDKGETMYTIRKERPDSPLKIDPAMAGALSWHARNIAISNGALQAADAIQVFFPGAEEEEDDEDYEEDEEDDE